MIDLMKIRELVEFACHCCDVPELADMLIIKMNNRLKITLGQCVWSGRRKDEANLDRAVWVDGRKIHHLRLEFNPKYLDKLYNEEREEWENLIVHETCHAIDKYKETYTRQHGGHGPSWRKYMELCGVPAERYYTGKVKTCDYISIHCKCGIVHNMTKTMKTRRMNRSGCLGRCKKCKTTLFPPE